MAGAVAADYRLSPFPCRKTAHHAASSTSSSARMGTASPCAGAVTPMQTAWTAPTRRTAALEVTAVLRGSLGADCFPPPCPCVSCVPLWVEALPYVCVSTALPSSRACTHTYLSPREPPAMLEIGIVAPDRCFGSQAALADMSSPPPCCHSSHVSPGRVPVQQHTVQAPGLEVRWGG